MNLVPNAVSSGIARAGFSISQKSPGVLFGAGLVGMGASTVLACRATLQMSDILEEAKERIEDAKYELADNLEIVDRSERDRNREVRKIQAKTSIKIVRAYAPAVVVGGVAVICLTKSHQILTSRNAGLVAAYSVLEKGFNEYRARVVEKYGELEDLGMRHGSEKVNVAEPGAKKKMVTRVAPGDPSIYAAFFDETCGPWSKEPEYNMIFLKAQQNYANDLLHARGHVLLNDVYDLLDIPRSRAGTVVGWALDRHAHDVDNYISFGVFDGESDVARQFVNGREGSILLDFNVDGLILNKIEQFKEV